MRGEFKSKGENKRKRGKISFLMHDNHATWHSYLTTSLSSSSSVFPTAYSAGQNNLTWFMRGEEGKMEERIKKDKILGLF